MRIKLGFSPCPNDTFMLYGLLHGKVDTMGYSFEPTILDVEELNLAAQKSAFDVTKLSFRTYYDTCEMYDLLHAGAALGYANGPLLIAAEAFDVKDLADKPIAIPGEHTTAAFLMRDAFPGLTNLVPMLFSDIESAIESGKVAAGVIIHETRFMYAQRGFHLLADLGVLWENKTGGPIPLGCFVARKEYALSVKQTLATVMATSIRYSHEHYDEVLPFMKLHAQELDGEVIREHVAMFVNDFSIDLGSVGAQAVKAMFDSLNKNFQLDKKVQIY